MPTIDLEGAAVNFIDEGAGEPVILIHGFPLSSELWIPQRGVLADDYRVITPDLRGFGQSEPPRGNISIAQYADDIIAIMDSLGIGQATIGGLSMGGYIAMAMLRRNPNRVRAVMLMATKAPGDTEAGKQARNEMIALARSDGAAAVAEKMLPKMLTARTRAENPELVAFARTMMAGASVEGITGALGALRDRPDSTATLQNLQLPVLILVGAEDELTPPSEAEAMHAAIRESRLEVIPEAAHLVNLEQPEAVNRAMLEFLAKSTGV
jgi:pimeloyl-ACP methyl ester carboxylesterase